MTRHIIPTTLAAALLLASCSMMKDDRSDCPTCYNPLHVTLKYDYNMQRANMFSDHVGAVTCYLLDTRGNVVDYLTSENTAHEQPLKNTAFEFNFEGLDEGDYRLMAVAAQRPMGNAADDDDDNAIIPAVTPLHIGDNVSTLRIRTPYGTTPNADGLHPVPATELDTVWHALNTHTVHVEPYTAAYDTLSLMRLTNNLNIMLAQTDNPTENRDDQYEVRIIDHNALLNYDAAQLASPNLLYTPYAHWTTETIDDNATDDDDDDNDEDDDNATTTDDDDDAPAAGAPTRSAVVARTAHYDLSFPRLFTHEDASENPHLQIINKEDGETIVDIDLIHYLSLARNASERVYPTQEFLDREYDYRLSFILQGNQWRYMTISISLLSWSLRIQNETL